MPLETDLIVYWDCSSTNASVGTYPATFSGGVSIGAGTGKFGDGWDFAAVADVVTLATPVPLTSAGWTVMAWGHNLRPDSAYRTLFYNGIGGATGAMHFITAVTTAFAGAYSNSTMYSTGTALLSAAYAGWHHYAAVFNGTTVTLYVDGAAIGSPVTPTWAGSHQIQSIGGDPWAEGFAEKLDDIAAVSYTHLTLPTICSV